MDMANLNGKMVHFIEETIIMGKEKVMGNFIIPKIIVSVEVFGKKAFYKVKANMFNHYLKINRIGALITVTILLTFTILLTLSLLSTNFSFTCDYIKRLSLYFK
jgi:hypothetical protein